MTRRYLIRRLAVSLLVLLIASILIFLLLHLAPGNPAAVLAGADATPAQVQAIAHSLHLDQSLPAQYWHWLSGVLSGDLGSSYTLHRPIGGLITSRLQTTVQLVIAGAIIMMALGTVLGVLAAGSRRGWVRNGVETLSTLALSTPPFVSSVVLVFVFAVSWRLLPVGGEASVFSDPSFAIQYLILPAIAVSLPGAGVIARLIATEMRRAEREEFTRTAISKGAGRRRVLWRHVLPNSLGPAVVELGIRIGELVAGAVVVEALFTRTGIGTLLISAVQDRDYVLAQDLLLISVAFAIVMQLLTEVSMARLDRRIQLGQEPA